MIKVISSIWRWLMHYEYEEISRTLSPCRFCNQQPYVIKEDDPKRKGTHYKFTVVCLACSSAHLIVMTRQQDTPEAAAKVWNLRGKDLVSALGKIDLKFNRAGE